MPRRYCRRWSTVIVLEDVATSNDQHLWVLVGPIYFRCVGWQGLTEKLAVDNVTRKLGFFVDPFANGCSIDSLLHVFVKAHIVTVQTSQHMKVGSSIK